MRADIVPGAVFSDYQLSDHRGMRLSRGGIYTAYPVR